MSIIKNSIKMMLTIALVSLSIPSCITIMILIWPRIAIKCVFLRGMSLFDFGYEVLRRWARSVKIRSSMAPSCAQGGTYHM